MKWLQSLAFMMLFTASYSAKAVEVKDLSLDWQKYMGTLRLLELPYAQQGESLGLNLNLGLIEPFYWNNRLSSISSASKFQWIGWQFELGANIASVDVFYSHHSQHTLDGSHPFMGYPLQNSVGFRWKILP